MKEYTICISVQKHDNRVPWYKSNKIMTGNILSTCTFNIWFSFTCKKEKNWRILLFAYVFPRICFILRTPWKNVMDMLSSILPQRQIQSKCIGVILTVNHIQVYAYSVTQILHLGSTLKNTLRGFSDEGNISRVNLFRNNFDANRDIFLCLKAI